VKMRIFGLDISLDHGGMVVLDICGKVFDYCFFTDIKNYAKVDPDHLILLSKKKKEEPKETFRLRRLNEYLNGLWDLQRRVKISWNSSLYYFSIEGYSYASQSTSICQIAELTGYLKHMIFEGGGYIRIHDPLTVKLFSTGKGNCTKKEVVEKALPYFKISEGLIKRKVVKKEDKKVEEFNGPSTDLADAYFLARMLYTELMLRKGTLTLDKLSENERRIFLRTTKAHPVNLLDRPFIRKD